MVAQIAFSLPVLAEAPKPATVTECSNCRDEWLNPAGVQSLADVERALDEIAAGPLDAQAMVGAALKVAYEFPEDLHDDLAAVEEARALYVRAINRATSKARRMIDARRS